MAGVQCLEKIGRLPAPHLAHDDVVGPVAERVADEVADRDGGPFARAAPRLEAEAVRPLDPELEGVLDRDDPVLFREEPDERAEERGLPRPRAPGDEDVPPGAERVAGPPRTPPR